MIFVWIERLSTGLKMTFLD